MKLERWKIADIKRAEWNPRTITIDNLSRLEDSVKLHGMIQPPIINSRDKTLISGHQRLHVLKNLGYTEVDCVIVDMPEAQAKACAIVMNNQKAQGEFDFKAIADLLGEIDTGDIDVQAMTGFDAKDLEDMMTWTPAPEPQAAPPAEAAAPEDRKGLQCPRCGHVIV